MTTKPVMILLAGAVSTAIATPTVAEDNTDYNIHEQRVTLPSSRSQDFWFLPNYTDYKKSWETNKLCEALPNFLVFQSMSSNYILVCFHASWSWFVLPGLRFLPVLWHPVCTSCDYSLFCGFASAWRFEYTRLFLINCICILPTMPIFTKPSNNECKSTLHPG